MMIKIIKIIAVAIMFLMNHYLSAQLYSDYLGAGHINGIKVTASSSFSESTPIKSIDASGMDAKFFDVARFLSQATLGADSATIASVKNIGYSAWLEDQFLKKPSYMLPMMEKIWAEAYAQRLKAGQPKDDIFGPYGVHFNYAWWQTNLTNLQTGKNNDLVRQRVAMALSEILVVSSNSSLGDWGEALSTYYDLLIKHSFGNYKDLLFDVSTSFSMGYYLSHLNNPKTNDIEKIRPDENYAREVMQLFSIGLFMLNDDGTEKLDSKGNRIPTYNNDDIKQMAKIFTGLHGGAVMPCPPDCPTWWPKGPEFGLDQYFLIKTQPMIMSNKNHEGGAKLMPDRVTKIEIPNDGMAEIKAAINFLFNHPNTPPFISYRLIQRLTTSNPSPAYVQRIASVFKNNGNGIRGDLKAVIKAILLDTEARNTKPNDARAGMLMNPTLRYTQFCLANKLDSDLGRYWNNGYNYRDAAGHHPLTASTVFNFYTPNYQPTGEIRDAGLVAPEFKIHNSSTAVNYVNYVSTWTSPWENNDKESGWVMWSWENYEGMDLDSAIHLNTLSLEKYADDNERVIHELNKVLGRGQLSDNTIAILRKIGTTIDANYNPNDTWWVSQWRRHKVRNMLYFLMISPDYNILK
jgi:uncharacterized protein (DUF1800 family)